MPLQRVRDYLQAWQRQDDILLFDASTATVPLAAQAVGVIPARIAKSISLRTKEGGTLVLVVAGDARIDNGKFKRHFGFKAHMLSPEEALDRTGFAVGGVCPFALPDDVPVCLDESMRRFHTVFPACGTANSAIELTMTELQEYARCREWVDVCKLPEDMPE